jgi:branched-chain amino acid transport system permease protein
VVGLVSLRIKGVYFAIFTLAFAQVFFILARNRLLVDITGAEDGFFFDVPDYIYGGTATTRLQLYYITVVVLVLVYLFIRRLVNSPTGRVFQAIRENENRAKTLGYNTLRYKLLSITFAGMLASVAGMLHVILNNSQPLPEFLGAVYTVDPLLSTLLGGVGTFVGPALGATVLHLGEEALRSSDIMVFGNAIGDYWLLALGIAFIVIVLVFPKGIVGTFNEWRMKRRGTIARSQMTTTVPATEGVASGNLADQTPSGEGD